MVRVQRFRSSRNVRRVTKPVNKNSPLLGSRHPIGAAIIRLACGTVLPALLFWVWYCWAADYGYTAVSGTYGFQGDGERSTLVLLQNRAFQQERSHAGNVDRAEGTWQRAGEGGVVFSKEFLKVTGQKVSLDGQARGEVKKTFGGMFLSIVLDGDKRPPVFHKKVFP